MRFGALPPATLVDGGQPSHQLPTASTLLRRQRCKTPNNDRRRRRRQPTRGSRRGRPRGRKLRSIGNLRHLHIQRRRSNNWNNWNWRNSWSLLLLVGDLLIKVIFTFHPTTNNFRRRNYDPPGLIPTPVFDILFLLLLYTYLTPNPFNGFLDFFIYQNQTPALPNRHLFLRQKALLRQNVKERRTWEREERMKDDGLTNDFL